MITLYGIPNCGSVKKARDWLESQNIAYEFHDFKKAGIDKNTIAGWMQQASWEVLVNKKGTTWRGLPEATKDGVTNATSATKLMIENSSVRWAWDGHIGAATRPTSSRGGGGGTRRTCS